MGDNNEKNKTEKAVSVEIAVIDERTIWNKIYVVRGIQVMLDFELAEIYGYTTSAFNQQVRRNEVNSHRIFDFNYLKKNTISCYHKMLQQVGAGTEEPDHGCFLKVASICL